MTDDDLAEIERRNNRLHELVNAHDAPEAAQASNQKEVRDYLKHIDAHFPGRDVVLLLREVRRLREMLRTEVLTDRLDGPCEKCHGSGTVRVACVDGHGDTDTNLCDACNPDEALRIRGIPSGRNAR